ncbi:hypothetical protein ACFSM5_04840 [Lacibacterium aquatile]|uniref:Lycopene cyclase domain-containing protein n=1 Tax=Lacibacterium aquatile TaxID=1168082 RepID=A0ABW5DMQ2_9PROT
MDWTPLSHGLLAVAIQVAFAASCRPWFKEQAVTVGAIAASMFYFGREFTQHERDIADARQITITQAFPDGLYLWNWTLDSLLDLGAPILFTATVAWIWRRRTPRKLAAVSP